jgi:hypothetical protein
MSSVLAFLKSNAIGLLALFVALGGTGYAATGGFTGGGEVRACAGASGSLTLMKGKKCKKGQTAISWSQAGPAGVKGPVGAPGAAGPAGATGAPGTPAVTLWARVDENGALQAGSGVTAVTGTDPYEVTFDRDVTKCGATATLNSGGPALPFATTTKQTLSPDGATVAVTNEGALAPREFTLAIEC